VYSSRDLNGGLPLLALLLRLLLACRAPLLVDLPESLAVLSHVVLAVLDAALFLLLEGVVRIEQHQPLLRGHKVVDRAEDHRVVLH
jgi:hypothetical protein